MTTGLVMTKAAATDETMVVDVSATDGTTHTKTGYSVVVDFNSDSTSLEVYDHYGQTTSGTNVTYSVGYVYNYDSPGDYGGEFVDAGGTYSINGAEYGIDVCTDPNKPFTGCYAVLATFGMGVPLSAHGNISFSGGLDYYNSLFCISW